MSISNLLKSALVIALGSVTGYSLMKYSQQPTKQNRSMASIVTTKLGKEQVARQFFDLQTDLAQISKSDSDFSEIKVKMTALRSFGPGLSYKWNLPNGVNLLQGPLQDQVPTLQSGEEKEFVIKVTGFSKELRKYLSFEISGAANQLPVKQEVLVSSRMEDSLEYLIQQSAKKEQQNGINKLGTKKSKFDPENVIK